VERLTRAQILKRWGRESGLMQTGTATGGAVSYVTDTTRLQSAQYSEDEWTGAWGRISYDAGGAAAAPEGDIRPITLYEPGNGKVTPSPDWSAAPAAGDIYQLWRYPHPQDVLDHLDSILTQETWLPCWQILTEVPDGDMEQSGITDWTAVNATVTKVTAEPAMSGTRWLSVATTSAGGSAKTGALPVVPGKSFYVGALSRCAASGTTATLTVYDETNSATIDTITHSQLGNVRMWKHITVPSTCYQVTIRLGSSENTKTTYWDDVVFYGLQDYSIALPWWVKNSAQVKGVFRMRPESIGTNLLNDSLRGEPDARWDIIPETAFGRNQLRLTARSGYMTEPLFIFGSRNETAFANENTDVKHVDGNWVNAALMYKVFSQLSANPTQGSLDLNWVKEQKNNWKEEYDKQKRMQQNRLELSIRSEAPDRLYYSDNRESRESRWVVS
jgi:hypothetical protein